MELCILLGCDYLEPVKGVGPKTALKLINEHGSLKAVVKHIRAKMAEKEAERAAQESSEEEEEKPAESAEENSDGEDGEEKPKPKPKKKKGKGKKAGGMSLPEEWPWEAAKALFLTPDVTPADELEVCGFRALFPRNY